MNKVKQNNQLHREKEKLIVSVATLCVCLGALLLTDYLEAHTGYGAFAPGVPSMVYIVVVCGSVLLNLVIASRLSTPKRALPGIIALIEGVSVMYVYIIMGIHFGA